MPIVTNAPAPDFALQSDKGLVRLSDYLGHWVVLYFYPKDNTTGCTQEACDFRDYQPDFKKLDTAVIGISKDTTESHKQFKEKFNLTFPLLSDTDGKVCELYETWVEKSMYGRKHHGIERSTFLIDPKGHVREIWRKVKAEGHAQDVLEYLLTLTRRG